MTEAELDLFFGALAVLGTVGSMHFLRVFGKLTFPFYGSELNIFTFGYLVELSTTALRGVSYWPRFDPSVWPFNKPTTLALIFISNFLLLAFNLKLSQAISDKQSLRPTKYLLKPLGYAIGCFCLTVFLVLKSNWG